MNINKVLMLCSFTTRGHCWQRVWATNATASCWAVFVCLFSACLCPLWVRPRLSGRAGPHMPHGWSAVARGWVWPGSLLCVLWCQCSLSKENVYVLHKGQDMFCAPSIVSIGVFKRTTQRLFPFVSMQKPSSDLWRKGGRKALHKYIKAKNSK